MSRFFDYNREGRGVTKSDIAGESPVKYAFGEFFHRFWQLVLLNAVYLLACVPIVTIGPATAAMNYVCRNASQGKPVSFLTDFIEKCKENFKQGLVVGLIHIVVGVILFFSFMSWTNDSLPASEGFRTVAVVVIFLFAYILFFGSFYLYPMMVSFDFSIKQLFRNSAILAMTQLWRNLIILALIAVLVVLTWFFDILFIPFHIFLSFSLLYYLSNSLIYPVLIRHVADDPTPSEEETDAVESAEESESEPEE